MDGPTPEERKATLAALADQDEAFCQRQWAILGGLPFNWDGHGAQRIHPLAIERAQNTCDHNRYRIRHGLGGFASSPVDLVVPLPDGGLIVIRQPYYDYCNTEHYDARKTLELSNSYWTPGETLGGEPFPPEPV